MNHHSFPRRIPDLVFILLLLNICVVSPAQAGNLGRLFFTPEQRSRMDHAYTTSTPANAAGTSPSVTVNGIVQRHGGPRTVWINGTPRKAGDSDANNPDAIPISVQGKSKPIKIKVGERISVDTPGSGKAQDP